MSTAAHSLDYAHHPPDHPVSSRYEYALENERARMLRRRFMWFTGTLICLTVLGVLGGAATAIFNSDARPGQLAANWITSGLGVMHLIALLLAFRYARKQERQERKLYKIAFWLVVGLGLSQIFVQRIATELAVQAEFDRQEQTLRALPPDAPNTSGRVEIRPSQALTIQLGDDEAAGGTPANAQQRQANRAARLAAVRRNVVNGANLATIGWALFSTHLVACLFLPWTAREAFRPALWLVGGAMAVVLFDVILPPAQASAWFLLAAAVLFPLAVLPGMGWCWWRHSRFRMSYRWRFESDQLRQLRQELDGARKIHDSSLPQARPDGPLRFSYVYEPMQQIGGDLIFVHPQPRDGQAATPEQRHTMVLLDVTGHGIAAALTVNRLVGELERLFAERPNISCGDVMAQLNRYVYLTLAKHGVFITGLALCVECEPDHDGLWCEPHTVSICNAGHPTSFLRRADGSTLSLESDCTMLGVLPPEIFDAEQRTLELKPGEAIVVYTDGANEAANPDGKMLGIQGFRRMIEKVGREPIGDESMPGQPKERDVDAFEWPDRLIRKVAAHRDAPPDDDTLIAVVYRPHTSAAPPRPSEDDAESDEAAREAELVDVA